MNKTTEVQESPIPIYVVEFMSQEWITWSLFSIVFISIPLILARFLNKSQKRMISYIMGGLLIIDFFAENIGYIASGTWDIQYNLPIQLCGISSLIFVIDSTDKDRLYLVKEELEKVRKDIQYLNALIMVLFNK